MRHAIVGEALLWHRRSLYWQHTFPNGDILYIAWLLRPFYFPFYKNLQCPQDHSRFPLLSSHLVEMLVFSLPILVAVVPFTATVFATPIPGDSSSFFVAGKPATSHQAPGTIPEPQVVPTPFPLPLISAGSPKVNPPSIYSFLEIQSLVALKTPCSALQVREHNFPYSFQWKAPGSQTYIRATLVSFVGNPSTLTNMIGEAYQNVLATIRTRGDGDIVNGVYRWTNNPDGPQGLQIWASNTNNHQLTYGVLGAALSALNEYMNLFGPGLATHLQVYDGVNQVGHGQQDIIPLWPHTRSRWVTDVIAFVRSTFKEI